MKQWTAILLAIQLLCNNPLLYGQENLLDEYEAFTRQQLDTYDRTIRRMNKEFALYLKQAWQPFETHRIEPLQKDPDTPTAKPATQTEVCAKAPAEKNILREKETPIIPIQPATPRIQTKEIDYFGTRLKIPFASTYRIQVRNASESEIATAWSRAADVDLNPLLDALQNYKQQLELNDWGLLLLARQAAKGIYDGENNMASTFLTAFCLNQLSQSIRLGRINNKLVLLAEIEETIYEVPQINCEGKTLTILYDGTINSNAKITTYTRSFPKATHRLSMALPQLPRLSEKIRSGYLPNLWKDSLIRVESNQNLIDFYASFPQTDFTVYGNAGLSPQVHALANCLKTFLHGKDSYEAASLLLDFVQNAFEYKSDRQQFGHEKIFFPDEMLHYPYNDCEDRAILYCHLIRTLLGLKVALVNYPNHIAAAVCFPSGINSGTQYRLGKETYTLCDPTYLGASIGDCMPQFEGKSPKLILLSNP